MKYVHMSWFGAPIVPVVKCNLPINLHLYGYNLIKFCDYNDFCIFNLFAIYPMQFFPFLHPIILRLIRNR